MDPERIRLEQNQKRTHYWKRWGPYVSGRQWGTVREDYSEEGDAWAYLSHDMARSRAYRWGEDGIGGICDNHQRLCFALALWNKKDPIIKERYFGLIPTEGNHGEDVKELYYYIDNTPTHSYMKYLYKYPQEEFPYEELIQRNREAGKAKPEYELYDTEAFKEDRYFDVFIEYAKDSPEDIYIRITVENRSTDSHPIDLLPTLWCRNTWSWGEDREKPHLKMVKENACHIQLPQLGERMLYAKGEPSPLFTENETNGARLGCSSVGQFFKDGINEYIVKKKEGAINPGNEGTKMAFHYSVDIPGKSKHVFELRLSDQLHLENPFAKIDEVFALRKKEADQFYDQVIPGNISEDLKLIQRQALAGMLWSKQFYFYVIEEWMKGDKDFCPPLPGRKKGRNVDWVHVFSRDVLSVPDSWEYPWFALWDSAFHNFVFATIDPDFAKDQLTVLTREWYMNPNGELPAYEWNFADVNPPVHAWATWRVYKIEEHMKGKGDQLFLERTFQKLIMNFTWWINRKDSQGKNIFEGGFLGMDNISVFNRSAQLPKGGKLYQSDATSWMGMYCLTMLTMATELTKYNPSYEDIASKFFQHFLHIAGAINYTSDKSQPLWDEEDGFYYDVFTTDDGQTYPIKVRSMVGLVPLLAVATIEQEDLDRMTGFKGRMDWFLQHRYNLCDKVASMKTLGVEGRRILSIVDADRLKRILEKLLDEDEFLSPHGIRSISKYHEKNPFTLQIDGHSYTVDYEPAESSNDLFGGNSNWRGPIWFPLNILLIESLQKYHHYYGDDFRIEFPSRSGNFCNLWEVAHQLSSRLVSLFAKDEKGRRPIYASREKFQTDPHFKDYILFNEYFHGDTGEGLGASHQTGWTGTVAKLIKQIGEYG